jgi:hypothetical protein
MNIFGILFSLLMNIILPSDLLLPFSYDLNSSTLISVSNTEIDLTFGIEFNSKVSQQPISLTSVSSLPGLIVQCGF